MTFEVAEREWQNCARATDWKSKD